MALEHTSTPHAPWFTIPCDNKWFRNLAVSQILRQELEAMKLSYPKPIADLAGIKFE